MSITRRITTGAGISLGAGALLAGTLAPAQAAGPDSKTKVPESVTWSAPSTVVHDAAPASTRTVSSYNGDSTDLYASGSSCTNGRQADARVNFEKAETSGYTTKVTAGNGTGRGITVTDAFVTSGTTRLETFTAAAGTDVPNGADRWIGGRSAWHRFPAYVVVKVEASTRPACKGTLVMSMTGLAQVYSPAELQAKVRELKAADLVAPASKTK